KVSPQAARISTSTPPRRLFCAKIRYPFKRSHMAAINSAILPFVCRFCFAVTGIFGLPLTSMKLHIATLAILWLALKTASIAPAHAQEGPDDLPPQEEIASP